MNADGVLTGFFGNLVTMAVVAIVGSALGKPLVGRKVAQLVERRKARWTELKSAEQKRRFVFGLQTEIQQFRYERIEALLMLFCTVLAAMLLLTLEGVYNVKSLAETIASNQHVKPEDLGLDSGYYGETFGGSWLTNFLETVTTYLELYKYEIIFAALLALLLTVLFLRLKRFKGAIVSLNDLLIEYEGST